MATGERLVHEPMRLLAVIQAPLARIDMVIDRNPILQRLFGNGWVSVAARESAGAGMAAMDAGRMAVPGMKPIATQEFSTRRKWFDDSTDTDQDDEDRGRGRRR